MRFDLCDDGLNDRDRNVARLANTALDAVVEAIWPNRYVELPEHPTASYMFVIFRQVFLQRLLELGEAVVRECQAGRWTLMATASRSVIETSALLNRILKRLEGNLAAGDTASFRKLLYQSFFATRDQEVISQGLGESAVNILTAIDEYENDIAGLRRCYDRASEIAHPNAAGLLNLYTRSDYQAKVMELGASSTTRQQVFGFVYFSTTALSRSFVKMEEMHLRMREIIALEEH